MSSIWIVGSLNVDLVMKVDRFPEAGESLIGESFETFLGGKGGNQAVALARLEAAPRMVGRVGADQFGTRYLEALRRENVDTRGVRQVEGFTTGTAFIEVESTGQNRIVVVPGANGALDRESALADLEAVRAGDLVLMQLEIPFETIWAVIAFVHERGATVIMDPAPAARIPEEVMSRIGWITPNEHEASIAAGREPGGQEGPGGEDGLGGAARLLLEKGCAGAIVKAGSRGAFLATRDDPEPRHIPGFTVDAVDTTAAGDAFNGGLAWALSRGQAPDEAVRTANAVAALSVTGMGAQTAMPRRSDLEHFLAKGRYDRS
ncbi:MAG: ribokinase [Spirochaetaceae bacterium]|nr:MAG: ribokinase [Spirochaetaceae bacterium]